MNWFKHAFAVESNKPFEPTEQQCEIVDRVCREVVRRRMVTPALMALEMSRPLNYIGAQVMHFFGPIATVLVDAEGYRQFAEYLEHRGSIGHLTERLEAIEAEHQPEAPARKKDATS